METDPDHRSTLAVHGGEPRPKAGDAITNPIHNTATYTFEDTAELRDFFEGRNDREEYGRYGNPTVSVAEAKIAELDSAESAALFSSGMAAITTTLLAMLKSGDHVVMTSDCYRRTRQFIGRSLGKFGVTATLVEPGDYEALEEAIEPGSTRLILAESPTNPYLYCADLEKLVEIRDRYRGIKIMIDSTFATPINQRPIEFGIDLVVHSATKYLGGHNDLLAGAVCGNAGIIQAISEFRGVTGGVLDAHPAYMLIRGMKTLDLRVQQQNDVTLRVSRWLEEHPAVDTVYYPGLESHPSHDVARRQMSGYGGVVSFLVDGELDDVSRFIDACEIPQIGPSLGGVESLIEQPALMSYYELTTEQRRDIGIYDNLVRFAIGVEDGDDIIADLDQALEQV